jgi:glycosyltransferase involved in cell wall biosynthesis
MATGFNAGTDAGNLDVTYIGFLLGHGGDALQMLELAKGIHRAGGAGRIIVPELESSVTLKERCDTLGIECERSNLITASREGARQRLPSVVKLLRQVQSRIVHFHTGNSCLPRSVTAALELLRYRPSIVTLQSPYETITPGSTRARLWASTARRRMAAVVSPSEHGTQSQRRCGVPPEIAVTVRNSIDVAAMAGGDGRVARSALGLGPEDPVVLFSSRLDNQKRPVDAVQIFAAVADTFPSAVLVFVGRGDLEDAVAEAAARFGLADRVRLVGYQTNVPDWLAAATVWLLPTERENFSVAVIEALAAGCAVLSTRCPGNDEVLVDGVNALTFSVGDVAAGASALARLLQGYDLRTRLRAAAQETAQAYTAASMVDGYRRIYERVSAARGSTTLRS